MNRPKPGQYSMTLTHTFFRPAALLLMGLALAGPASAQLAPATPPAVTPLTEAGQLERQGRYAEALAKVKTIVDAEPGEARPRFLMGVILMNMNRLDDAITVFQKLREDFPELPEPYNNLGVLYLRQGKFQQAQNALEIAVQAHPGYATAHENLGDLYAHLAGQEYAKGGAPAEKKLQAVRQILTPAPAR